MSRTRCYDCAFTPGTGANNTERSRIAAELCVLSGEPFYCHVEKRVCVGWSERAAAEDPQDWQRLLAAKCLEILDSPPAEEETVERIMRAVDEVHAEFGAERSVAR